MPLYAVVTVDLDAGVTSTQRNKFDQYLAERHYTKQKLTTIWTVMFTPTTSKPDAKALLRQHVDDGARFAGITRYEVLFSLSDEPAIKWNKVAAPQSLLGGAAFYRS